MPYEITAARKRPKGFEDLAGQEFVSATLEASLASGRIAHAYLFSGPRGCGKTSTARILARALNCERGPSARPCGNCANCQSISAGSSLDVIEIDGASNTSVDNVRQIKDEVLFPPNSAKYKVYIIDEVHMLSMNAFNALLKTIEEPPPYVVFIFATTELHKVPATIKSRCQQFAFRLIAIDVIKQLLSTAAAEAGVHAEDAALLWIAKESGGSLRDAYTLFDQVVSFSEGQITMAGIRGKLGLVGLEAMNGLFEGIAAASGQDARAASALDALDALLGQGVSPEQFTLDCIDYQRSLLLLANGLGRENLLGSPESAFSDVVRKTFSCEQIERGLGIFLALYRDLRLSPNPRFELELALSRLARLREFVSPSDLAGAVSTLLSGRGLEMGERGIASHPLSTALDGSGQEEKKKPEIVSRQLPHALSIAMSSLAGTLAAGEQKSSSRTNESDKPRQVADQDVAGGEDWHPGEGGDDLELSTELRELKQELMARLRNANPLLVSGLAAARSWHMDGEKVIIGFSNPMQEKVVRSELGHLANMAAEITGRNLRFELGITGKDSAKGPQGEVSEQVLDSVAIVERVFRGQRLQRNGSRGDE